MTQMIIPKNIEELANYVKKGKNVFFFTADWCGDCSFIKPQMPETEAAFPQFQFIQVDRDDYLDVAAEWNIFGIPSFVVTNDGEELGRLVNKNRKTKEEIVDFLEKVEG
ncbi:thioredoxin family protein [Candidatus Enterococcus ferrettii]